MLYMDERKVAEKGRELAAVRLERQRVMNEITQSDAEKNSKKESDEAIRKKEKEEMKKKLIKKDKKTRIKEGRKEGRIEEK